MAEHSEDCVMVKKSVVGGLTANVKRWRGRASAERLKRQRWRKRALAAEAEVERLREALKAAAKALDSAGDHAARPFVANQAWAASEAAQPTLSGSSGGEG